MCSLSKPRAFRLISLTIIWLHLFVSILLIMGIAIEDSKQEPFCESASDGLLKFYVLCFSALSIVPILLALNGIYKKSPLFLAPYVISLMTMVSLLVLVIIVIILGMVFDPQHVLDKWSTPKQAFSQTMLDVWLTVFGLGVVIVVISICLFFVFSYYKILLKQEELNQLTYIETTNVSIQPVIPTATVIEAPTAIPEVAPRLTSPPISRSNSASTVVSPENKDVAEEEPPPSYSRAQSIIGHSYV